MFAIHLVLQYWEWIQCMCASFCSRGETHARPLGWHSSVQNLMLALLLSRGNGVCIPAKLSEEKEGDASHGSFCSRVTVKRRSEDLYTIENEQSFVTAYASLPISKHS